MRLDKFLKVSRIIKRRTIANEICSKGKALLNERVAKPSSEVKADDVISLQFGEKVFKYQVLSINEKATKQNCEDLYRVL